MRDCMKVNTIISWFEAEINIVHVSLKGKLVVQDINKKKLYQKAIKQYR